jgi:uncharacterized spore protein YtfJ
MDQEFGGIVVSALESQEDATALIEKLFEVAQPSAVYGEPVTAGDYTVITASEVKVGMGYGYGAGGSVEAAGAEVEVVEEPAGEAEFAEEAVEEAESGFGAGGGGGGVSGSRPVAAISIGPEGVCVQPVFDATKIALAFLTAFGAMFMMLGRMKRVGRELAGE